MKERISDEHLKSYAADGRGCFIYYVEEMAAELVKAREIIREAEGLWSLKTLEHHTIAEEIWRLDRIFKLLSDREIEE